MLAVAERTNKIRDLLAAKGMSIYALAQEMRMPHHNVKRIADAPTIPEGTNYKTLLKIAEALGVTIDELEAKE